jgi:hypothetical protein
MIVQRKFPQAIIVELQKQKAPGEMWKMANFRRELETLIYGREQAEKIFATPGYGNQASGQQPLHEKVRSGMQQKKGWRSQPEPTKHITADAFAARRTSYEGPSGASDNECSEMAHALHLLRWIALQ